jgi:anti-anti-sigma factor
VDVFSRKKGKICIIALSGRLTLGEVEVKLKRSFVALLDTGERRFLFNMAAVPYIDSAGVGELVACAKRAYEKGGVIKIVLPNDCLTYQIFVKTSLDKVFELYPTEDAALACF